MYRSIPGKKSSIEIDEPSHFWISNQSPIVTLPLGNIAIFTVDFIPSSGDDFVAEVST